MYCKLTSFMYYIVKILGDHIYVFEHDTILYLGVRSDSVRLGAGSEYECESCRLIQMCVWLLFVECRWTSQHLLRVVYLALFVKGLGGTRW